MFSILHISDLHRSPRDNITNAELISALVSDQQRYIKENQSIQLPDAIVISGDVIQGVALGTPDAETRLNEQYAIALDFIKQLASRFVGGDHSKVIVVPGNHDIDWVQSRSAMTEVPENEIPSNLTSELYRTDTLYRWDWKTRKLYLITDQAAYSQRMDAYWKFFEEFYGKTPNLLNVKTGQAANLFSLHDNRIGVAAFDSCFGNDCFAFHGSIPRGTVAQAQLDLIDNGGFELLIAVWHHNIEGPPYRTDYMDVDIVRGMIGRGFRLGLYGHQHRAEASPIQIYLANQETMAAVSAGSLCAGSSELPVGNYRSYNIIEINDDMQSARIHVREMGVSNLFSASHRAAFGGNSWFDLKWDAPADLAGRAINSTDHHLQKIINKAEFELKSGSPIPAKNTLLPMLARLPDYGRKLLIEAARQTDDIELIRTLLLPPRTISEFIEITEALIRANDLPAARQCIDKYSTALNVTEPHINELNNRIATEKAMKSDK